MKENKLTKLLPLIVAIIGVVGAILFVRVLLAGEENIETDPLIQASVVNPIVSFSTFLLYIAVAVTVVLSLWSLIKNPAALKKTLLGLLVLGAFFAVAYILGDSNVVLGAGGEVIEGGEAGAATNKWASTGIWYSVILGAIGLAFFVWDMLKGLVKS